MCERERERERDRERERERDSGGQNIHLVGALSHHSLCLSLSLSLSLSQSSRRTSLSGWSSPQPPLSPTSTRTSLSASCSSSVTPRAHQATNHCPAHNYPKFVSPRNPRTQRTETLCRHQYSFNWTELTHNLPSPLSSYLSTANARYISLPAGLLTRGTAYSFEVRANNN